MDWLKDVVAPTLTTLIWAGVAYRLGKLLVTRFETAISEAVKRLRRLGPAEFDQGQATQNPDVPKALEPSSPPRLLAAPDSMVGRLELPVREWLNTVPAQNREEELIRSLVNWQIGWNFEWVNFSILGSQMQLLGAANSQPIALTQVRAFYDRGAEGSPEYYASYSFESWLNWLQDAAKLVRLHDGFLYITEDGREFIKYVISRGYPLGRPH